MKPFAVLACLISATPLVAQDLMSSHFRGGAECYRRIYDSAHLASHPQQMVEDIAFGPSTTLIRGAGGELIFNVEVRLRGQDWPAYGVAYCQSFGRLECLLEGDGGFFTVEAGDKGSILLRVGDRGIGFEGPEGFVLLEAHRGDDRLFRLDPTETAGCPQI